MLIICQSYLNHMSIICYATVFYLFVEYVSRMYQVSMCQSYGSHMLIMLFLCQGISVDFCEAEVMGSDVPDGDADPEAKRKQSEASR